MIPRFMLWCSSVRISKITFYFLRTSFHEIHTADYHIKLFRWFGNHQLEYMQMASANRIHLIWAKKYNIRECIYKIFD